MRVRANWSSWKACTNIKYTFNSLLSEVVFETNIYILLGQFSREIFFPAKLTFQDVKLGSVRFVKRHTYTETLI